MAKFDMADDYLASVTDDCNSATLSMNKIYVEYQNSSNLETVFSLLWWSPQGSGGLKSLPFHHSIRHYKETCPILNF